MIISKTFYYAESGDADWMPTNLIEAISWLQKKLSEIPFEMRRNAVIEIRSSPDSYGDSVAIIEITGVREETESERLEREIRATEKRTTQLLFLESRERSVYEALKRKYE